MLLQTLLLASLISPFQVDSGDRIDRLPKSHRDWLEREAVYIITERENDVFLSLESFDERQRFIEAFWRKRDPNRTTPENEFRIEHYRRIDYANTFLGRETFLEGWQTDRGRYYIILGEPREIQRFEGYGTVVSAHLWFYQGDASSGLPSFFYLVFYKRNNFGQYRLYSPSLDGPQALLTGNSSVENMTAVELLGDISSELATASLSLDLSDPPDFFFGQPSLTAETLIARIEDSPKRSIRADYADAGVRYGNRVSADYTFNFVPSRSEFSFLVGTSGTALVQYSIEIDPEDFTTESDEEMTKFYTTLDLTIEARTDDGTLVFANDKEAYLELTPNQMQDVQTKPFSYQDQFPLVSGDYAVSVILRNRVLSRYTVAESNLHIPKFLKGVPELADITLGFDRSIVAGNVDEGSIRTYQVGSFRIHPATDNIFVIGDTFHLLTQAIGASLGDDVSFELVNDDEVLLEVKSSVGVNGTVVGYMELGQISGGVYEVRARLSADDGEVLSEKRKSVTVSPRSEARRPGFVYRRGFNTQTPGLVDAMRGEQLWNAGRFEESRTALEDAVASNPRHVGARVMLATINLRNGNAVQAYELLEPVEEVLPNQYEVVSGMGFACYLNGDYVKAVEYFERAITLKPPMTLLLNSLADSYERLSNIEKARETYTRSLQLDGDQAEVRERLDSLVGPDSKY